MIREAAKTGRLVLVDLAGSENVQRSGADEAPCSQLCDVSTFIGCTLFERSIHFKGVLYVMMSMFFFAFFF